MPRFSRLARSQTYQDATRISYQPHPPFLVPALRRSIVREERRNDYRDCHNAAPKHRNKGDVDAVFFSALAQVGDCHTETVSETPRRRKHSPACLRIYRQQSRSFSSGRVRYNNGEDLDQFFQEAPNKAQPGSRPHVVQAQKIATEKQQNSDPGTRLGAVGTDLTEQLRLIKAVRQFERKLAKARFDLQKVLQQAQRPAHPEIALPSSSAIGLGSSEITIDGVADRLGWPAVPIELTKDDYLNLVDLYFYSHQGRFGRAESPDLSPTPFFLEDYSFKLSGDFTKPVTGQSIGDEDEDEDDGVEQQVSPLKHVGEILKSRQLRDISTMQAFIDLLLDDHSSNKALYDAYERLPQPGVAYLPSGVIRVFLQRMSTPWTKSAKSMLRYLSLIDEMQKAGLPITNGEWSSAIYLAGRSFSRVTENDVAISFRIWRQMENEAGVKATHVTFNILFDIAIRAGKFVLGEIVLREMHERGLRLNRLGRVSLIYYHGCRGDGDGVRKTYRDFVESGEIVDTLVLNCVMASLIKAQEPTAAEQIYERMKRLQQRLRKGRREDGEEVLFMKYPPPGPTNIGTEVASNHLGRILLHAARLRGVLPEHHAELQNAMPLSPDHITFRNLISYHANTSGDLDRLVVLMNDMQQFNLPLGTLIFQLLFKGFANNGGSKREEAKWTVRRLELVWAECLDAIRKAKTKASGKVQEDSLIELPTIQRVEELSAKEEESEKTLRASHAQRPRQTAWGTFLARFASQPSERERGPRGPRSSETFSSRFFPKEHIQPSTEQLEPDPDTDYALPAAEVNIGKSSSVVNDPIDIRASKSLVIWVIRAYAKCTSSRSRLEEVWFQVRGVWKPTDDRDRDAVVWALRHALKQCDEAVR